jgi:elongation factor Ts
MVKELRGLTGAGMVDCKNALVETDGDIKKAIDLLREKGLSAAAKKAGRIAAEGIVAALIADDGKKGVALEVNCETDFVAINAEFKNYVYQLAGQLLDSDAASVEEFLEEKFAADPTLTVAESVSHKIAFIGEKISIRRFGKLTAGENGFLAHYIHGNGKMGVILEMECAVRDDATLEAGKNVCMQIAAMYPKYVSRDEIPAEFIEKEREILQTQLRNDEKNAKKPDAVLAKIVEGRLNKSLEEYCLLEQAYVKDNNMSVAQYLESVGKAAGAPIALKRFISFERGEGIEKRQENFAEEVGKAMRG